MMPHNETPDTLTLTPPPEARAQSRAPLPLVFDPRQGSLFTLPRAMPTRKLVPAVAQNPRQTALEAANVPQSTQEAITLATPTPPQAVGPPSVSNCPECGESVPCRAKACPNCYTRRTPKGGE